MLSGSGGFTKQGASTFTLVGNSSYGGATRVEAGTLNVAGTLASSSFTVAGGTLALATDNRLMDSASVSVLAGASLTLGGNDTVASLALAGTLNGGGTLTAATYALDGGSVGAGIGLGAAR